MKGAKNTKFKGQFCQLAQLHVRTRKLLKDEEQGVLVVMW